MSVSDARKFWLEEPFDPDATKCGRVMRDESPDPIPDELCDGPAVGHFGLVPKPGGWRCEVHAPGVVHLTR